MKIQDALKETGKAATNDQSGYYVKLYAGVLYWYDKDDNKLEPTTLDNIGRLEWYTHHEVKEIRPEKAGEVWKYGAHEKPSYIAYVSPQNDKLVRYYWNGYNHEITKEMIHGKNGWTRLFPLPEESMKEYADRVVKNMEDKNVERVTIEHSGWRGGDEVCFRFNAVEQCEKDMINSKIEQADFMILEIPKETS